MLALREWQQGLAAAVFGGEPAPIVAYIGAGAGAAAAVDAADRVAIYRNNWREGFAKALAIGFPVIERLVGNDYFRALAHDYQADHPSRSGDLNLIGRDFVNFLARRFSSTPYAYLADIAQLEQTCEQVQLAPETPAGSIERLREIATDRYPGLLLRLHPAARLMVSRFPVSRIWIANQADAMPEVINLDSGAESLLIRGVGGGLELHRLRDGEYALARACSEGAPLGAALEVALHTAPGFDLAQALQRLFTAGAFQAF